MSAGLPDWVAPGRRVGMIRRDSAAMAVVERLTKTLVVTDRGRFDRDTLVMKDSAGPLWRTKLVPLTDVTWKRLRTHSLLVARLVDVEERVARIPVDATTGRVDAALSSVDALAAALRAYRDLTISQDEVAP